MKKKIAIFFSEHHRKMELIQIDEFVFSTNPQSFVVVAEGGVNQKFQTRQFIASHNWKQAKILHRVQLGFGNRQTSRNPAAC